MTGLRNFMQWEQDFKEHKDPVPLQVSALDQLAAQRVDIGKAAPMPKAPPPVPPPPPAPATPPAPAAATAGTGGSAPAYASNTWTGGNAWRQTLSSDEAWIIQRESGFNPNARNPQAVVVGGVNYGHAYGLGQIVDKNRPGLAARAGVKDPNTNNPTEQLKMMRQYIKERYGTTQKAVAFWKAHNWY